MFFNATFFVNLQAFFLCFWMMGSSLGHAQNVSLEADSLNSPYLPVIDFQMSPEAQVDESVLVQLEFLQDGARLNVEDFCCMLDADGQKINLYPLLVKELKTAQPVFGFSSYFQTQNFLIGFQSDPYRIHQK